jgi:hypothetical protein
MGSAVTFLLLANLTQQYLLSYHPAAGYLGVRLSTRRRSRCPCRISNAAAPSIFMAAGRGTADPAIWFKGALAVCSSCNSSGACAMAIYSPLLLGVFFLGDSAHGGLMLFSLKVLRPLFAD